MRLFELLRRLALALGIGSLVSAFIKSRSENRDSTVEVSQPWKRIAFSPTKSLKLDQQAEVLVIGAGLTGAKVAAKLDEFGVRTRCEGSAFHPKSSLDRYSAVVIASPRRTHLRYAALAISAGKPVITLSDDLLDVQNLQDLGSQANETGVPLVVGAALTPGLSCLLVRHAVEQLESCREVVISKAGTAGPACARSHHASLKGKGLNWVDGKWEYAQAGTGRMLHYFPDPIGPRDCYRGSLASPVLLRPAVDSVDRIRARMEANRRDRVTRSLPMLRPPHSDGGPAGIRVEANGMRNGKPKTLVLATTGSPSDMAAVVAARATVGVLAGEAPVGFAGLASWENWDDLLADIASEQIECFEFGSGSRG